VGTSKSCVVLEESSKGTSEEVDKSRASSSMIKASSEVLASGAKGEREGKREEEEELPSTHGFWAEGIFRGF
jgi:hypothetical protein